MKKRIINNEKTRFVRTSATPLAKSPVSVFLPLEIDEFVRALPNRTEWLREAIAEKVEREQRQESA